MFFRLLGKLFFYFYMVPSFARTMRFAIKFATRQFASIGAAALEKSINDQPKPRPRRDPMDHPPLT